MSSREDEWLWGWDATPGIVSVWAEPDGQAFVYRRLPGAPAVICETERFRPWLLLSSLSYVAHLGARLGPERAQSATAAVTYEELVGEGALRFVLRADDGRKLTRAVLEGARALG